MIPLIPDAELLPSPVPEMLHKGRYTLYKTPLGGLHLVYRPDDTDQDMHMDIPAGMLRLSQAMGQGNMTFPQFMREAMALMSELKRNELYRSRCAYCYR